LRRFLRWPWLRFDILWVGLILYPILRVKTGIRLTAANWWTAGVTGVSLLCISNGGLSWAEQRVPSGIAALLVATISLWLVILDWLRPRGTRPGARVFVGLVMGFAGLALLVGPANLGGSRRIDLVGTGVLLTWSFIWARVSLYFEAAGYARIAAAGGGDAKPGRRRGAVGCGDSFGEVRTLHFTMISGRSWMALVYLVVFGSGIGFTAYLYILKNSTASKVATYAFVNPVVALFLGWMIAGETITTRTAIAAAVILTSVILVISAPRGAAAKVEDD
jgi:drug/metabolite transporter (DMT)-like permease